MSASEEIPTATIQDTESATAERAFTKEERESLQHAYETGFRKLQFPEPWEAIFRTEYAEKSILQARIAAGIGILLYMLFGFRDLFLAPEIITAVWIIRYGIIMPVLVLVLVLTFIRPLQKYILWMAMAAILAVGCGVFAVSSVMSRPLNYMIDTGLIPIIIFACTVSRMRFYQAATCSLILFVTYQGFAFSTGANAPFFMGSEPYQIHQAFSFLVFIVIVISLFASYLLEYRIRENFLQNMMLEEEGQRLRGLTDVLQKLSSTDGLTGLYNRRHFMQAFDAEWRRCQREHRPLGLILMDIDYFKPFNDNYGHQPGDEVLKKVGAALQGVAKRGGEMAARYGGEEFIMLFPDQSLEGIKAVADKVNKVIANLQIPHDFSQVAKVVTCSVGAVTLFPNNETTLKQVIERSDECLYAAKEGGRNGFVACEM